MPIKTTRYMLNVRGETLTFDGERVAHISSRRHEHGPHYPATPYAAKRERCSACRWFEIYLYVVPGGTEDGQPDYVAHTIGGSAVPGEYDLERVVRTSVAFDLVEQLTVRSGATPYLPQPSARALAILADRDDAVFEAYTNRAVV